MWASKDFAIWLQNQLYLTSLDAYAPDLFTDGNSFNRDLSERDRWNIAVDVIGAFLKADLIYICNKSWLDAVGLKSSVDLVHMLSIYDPFVSLKQDDIGASYWLDPLLHVTEFCKKLFEKHHICSMESSEYNKEFMAEIESALRQVESNEIDGWWVKV